MSLDATAVVLDDRDVAFLVGSCNFEYTCRCTQECISTKTPYTEFVAGRKTTVFRHHHSVFTRMCKWCRLLKHIGLSPPVEVVRNEYNRTITITPTRIP